MKPSHSIFWSLQSAATTLERVDYDVSYERNSTSMPQRPVRDPRSVKADRLKGLIEQLISLDRLLLGTPTYDGLADTLL